MRVVRPRCEPTGALDMEGANFDTLRRAAASGGVLEAEKWDVTMASESQQA